MIIPSAYLVDSANSRPSVSKRIKFANINNIDELSRETRPALFSLVCQSDVDECAEAIHSCLADVEECRNTDGAYECDTKCEKGFTYNIGLGICVGKRTITLFIINTE